MPPKVTKRWVPVNRRRERPASAWEWEATLLPTTAPACSRPRPCTTGWCRRRAPRHRRAPCAGCRSTVLGERRRHAGSREVTRMPTTSARSRTRCCTTSCRSSRRGRWCGPACCRGDGATSGRPRPALTSASVATTLARCQRTSLTLSGTLHLRSSDVDGAHDEDDARLWIRTVIKLGARVIHLVGHRKEDWLRGSRLAVLEHASFVSCHLKILKLSYALIDDNILRQLSSHCPSLEELNLKDCLITGHEISSASLKILTMFKCQINVNLSIAAPNLEVLRCISPITQAPSFESMGSLVTGTIILDDYAFSSDDFEDFSKDEFDETTDEDDDFSGNNRKCKTRYGFGAPLEVYGLGYKNDYGYGSDIESDDNSFEYSEIAIDSDEYGINADDCDSSMDGNRQIAGENSGCNDNKIKGGHNVLQCLSNASSLELLADAGEVILTRELKRCPSFSNLKTLSLGEWSMDPNFDALVFLLQHSPNLERFFLELKLNFNTRKPLVSGVKPKEKTFACKHLQMVKIKCSKDDVRIHKLAHLFRANGIPVDKILVRRSGSAYLRGKKIMKDIARHELEFWGM